MGTKFFCITSEMFTQHSFPKKPSGKVAKGFEIHDKTMQLWISSEAVTKPRTLLENGQKVRYSIHGVS